MKHQLFQGMASNFVKGSLTEMQIQHAIKECSICGDLGIEKALFQCERCLHRLQHRYCSKLYGYGELKELIYGWCLHEQESSCTRDRNTKQMRTAQYISREEPADLAPNSDNEKAKGKSSGHNMEFVNQPPATAIGNSENPQHSSQRKGMMGEKDKIRKQRFRYRSLAKLLQWPCVHPC